MAIQIGSEKHWDAVRTIYNARADDVGADAQMSYLPVMGLFIDVVGAEVTGFAMLLGDQVTGLYVAGRHERRGIGRALMAKAQSVHPTLGLEVDRGNIRAVQLYRRAGFEVAELLSDGKYRMTWASRRR
jgi:ribosomal protein S18 acetylase RimI-like enzyme